MTIGELTSAIEEFAPLGTQAGFDNSGLLVGTPRDQVRMALLCVDITEGVMAEAESMGADMVISHHPVIFHPLRRLNENTYIERVVAQAIRKGIALYASHTNLDGARGGLSYRLADMLGVRDAKMLGEPHPCDPSVGFGTVGELREAVPAEEFLRHVQKVLGVSVIRHSDICRPMVRRVAICSGSGASLIERAAAEGADIYISADFKYNDFLDADHRLIIADVGHFESEYCAIDLLYDVISKKLPNFALRKSVESRNPVNYYI